MAATDEQGLDILQHLLLELGNIQGQLPEIGREIGVLRGEMKGRDDTHNEWLQRLENRIIDLEEAEHRRVGRLAIFDWLVKVPQPIWTVLGGVCAFLGIHLTEHHK